MWYWFPLKRWGRVLDKTGKLEEPMPDYIFMLRYELRETSEKILERDVLPHMRAFSNMINVNNQLSSYFDEKSLPKVQEWEKAVEKANMLLEKVVPMQRALGDKMIIAVVDKWATDDWKNEFYYDYRSYSDEMWAHTRLCYNIILEQKVFFKAPYRD